MKVLPVEKFIIYSIIILALVFSAGLIRDYSIYSSATADIKNGEYLTAVQSLESLNNYKDAETLRAFCEIMSEYDPTNFTSIYHCYKGLSKLELDNKSLNDVFVKTTAEIESRIVAMSFCEPRSC